MPSRIGDDLLSLPAADAAAAQAMADRLRAAGGWLEVVPGIDSVVVRFDPLADEAAALGARLTTILEAGVARAAPAVRPVEIPVVYGGAGGPDLDAVCRAAGVSRDDFIAMHTAREFPVELLGFMPGFAFVGGLDERFDLPRLEAPRQRVAAGSVGIAGRRTGLYAVASPGGWPLVGRTPLALFDAAADAPFRLQAGQRVRFRAIDVEDADACA